MGLTVTAAKHRVKLQRILHLLKGRHANEEDQAKPVETMKQDLSVQIVTKFSA